VYLARLARPDGILAIHISNRSLDLKPVVEGLAQARHLSASLIDTEKKDETNWGSTWVLLARDASVLDSSGLLPPSSTPKPIRKIRLWTDDYSNLFEVVR
jgi:putative heme iron utilization protein